MLIWYHFKLSSFSIISRYNRKVVIRNIFGHANKTIKNHITEVKNEEIAIWRIMKYN